MVFGLLLETYWWNQIWCLTLICQKRPEQQTTPINVMEAAAQTPQRVCVSMTP